MWNLVIIEHKISFQTSIPVSWGWCARHLSDWTEAWRSMLRSCLLSQTPASLTSRVVGGRGIASFLEIVGCLRWKGVSISQSYVRKFQIWSTVVSASLGPSLLIFEMNCFQAVCDGWVWMLQWWVIAECASSTGWRLGSGKCIIYEQESCCARQNLLGVHFLCNVVNILDIWPFVWVRIDTLSYQFSQTFTVLIRW